jgi:hypothetical protein
MARWQLAHEPSLIAMSQQVVALVVLAMQPDSRLAIC